VKRQLRAYYENGGKEPPWKAALKRLSGKASAKRTKAALYLRALLDQALKDELSGAAPWQATPFWGSSGENPARNLRVAIAEALAKAPPSLATLTPVRWFLGHEKLARLQPEAFKAVTKLSGKKVNALLVDLALRPHPNSVVAVEALGQVARRKLPVKAERLAVVCHHYRASVRKAARATNSKLGLPEPARFDPTKAVQTEPIRKLMAQISRLIVDPPPVKAAFVRLTKDSDPTGRGTDRGWLVRETSKEIVILTPFGWHQTYRKTTTPGWVIRKNFGAFTLAKIPIKEEVKRVAALRKANDKNYGLSERGGLTGQFQGRGAGLYEIRLAHWLFAGKKFALASRVLFPALDTLYLDEHLVDIARDRLGQVYGYQMLGAFAGDRDYEKTFKWAKVLAKRFAGSRFHAYAVELTRQLPRRRDDFKKLKLPKAADWAKKKKTLTRKQQVDFLCARLRLLNCFQWGQPGGVSYSDTQYAEPCGIARNASWGLGKGTKVINPLVELAGQVDGVIGKKKDRPQGLGLTVKDIPLLAPHLREDWFMPTVSFWRDFHPDRKLHRTRPLVASLINDLAKRPLCDPAKLAGLTEKEREKEIQRIIRWAKENSGKAQIKLLLEAVENALQTGQRWWDVRNQADQLVQLKVKKAVPLLLRFLPLPSTGKYDIEAILDHCRRLDPAAVKGVAVKYLRHADLGVRAQAGFILLRTGDKEKARAALKRVLQKGDYSNVTGETLSEVVEALLKEGSGESRKAAAAVFGGVRLAGFDSSERVRIMKAFAKAGLPGPYRYYLRLLAVKGKQIADTTYGEPVAEVFASEVVDDFASDDPEVQQIRTTPAGKPKQRVVAVTAWLKMKIKKLKKGK
jgi:hypothetical protein